MESSLGPGMVPMRKVYTLREDLRLDPRHREKVHRLTLNPEKPYMGLSGKNGLFATDEWWDNIASGRIETLQISGKIESAYVAGQDYVEINQIDIRTQDGKRKTIGIYVNDKADLELFRVGRMVSITYALDELKPAPDGSVGVTKIALEMAVST